MTLIVQPAPLFSIEGDAYQCGVQYGELVRERFPGYRIYLDMAFDWAGLEPGVRRLVEDRAPFLLDLYRGLNDAADGSRSPAPARPLESCTSFGVSGSVTIDGNPLSGQTKDTLPESADLYIVLRMRIENGPTLLVLAYPGEILGYGLWSTGMSIFRNSLHSTSQAAQGLNMVQWGLLAMAGESVEGAVELARSHGLRESGNCLISDASGESVSVEFNAGGVSMVPARDGIAAHANHPEGPDTIPFDDTSNPTQRADSSWRAKRIRELLEAERGRLTAPKAMSLLADHAGFPMGLCAHGRERTPPCYTTAAVVADPAKGNLHVVRGSPCANWPVSYSL
jgi:isopenicillin-N N-acyltransferase-like protein